MVIETRSLKTFIHWQSWQTFKIQKQLRNIARDVTISSNNNVYKGMYVIYTIYIIYNMWYDIKHNVYYV